MLNNISNFFNLVKGGRVKKTLAPNDMIAIGVRNPVTQSNFQPSAIFFKDLEAQLSGGGVQSVTDNGGGGVAVNNIDPLNPVVSFTGVFVDGTMSGNGVFGNPLSVIASGVQSVTGLDTDNTDPLNPIVNIAVDGVTVTGDGTSGNPLVSVASGVTSVTGLDTDNTDPLNPIVQISVDGTTITGDGTPGNPLIGSGGSLPAWLEYDATDLTIWNNGQGNVATNTSYGDAALSVNTSGNSNTAIGYRTLTSNTTGIQNTAIGNQALNNNTSGQRNISVGFQSLYLNTIGSNNVSLGMYSLYSNTTGNTNVASGYQSLSNNTSAVGNTGIGHQALTFTTTGSSNTVIGALGLYSNSTGADNTAIGYGTVSGNFSSSVIIGRGATATASNQFVVGSSSYNAGTVTTEALVLTESWTVKINGVNYKIPLQIA